MTVIILSYWKLKDSLERLVIGWIFFPLSFRIDLGPKQNYHFLLGLISVNLVRPSDSWWWMPLLHPQSGWQEQWWVNAEQASGSTAIFILSQGAAQLPHSKFSYRGVQKDALGAHHFPSHLPAITLKKLKSQVGEGTKHSSNGNDNIWQNNLTWKPGKESQNHNMFEELLAIQGFLPTSATVSWTKKSNGEQT